MAVTTAITWSTLCASAQTITLGDLFFAVRDGDMETVRQYIASGSPIDPKNENGVTPLIMAAYYGKMDIADLLLASGAAYDAAYRTSSGITYLMVFSRIGDLRRVKALLDMGADIHGKDVNGDSALHWAIRAGQKATASFLIQKGADIHMKGLLGITPLIDAACKGDMETAGLIVPRLSREEIRYETPMGETAIHFAVGSGNRELIMLLINRGADINQRTRDGSIPMFRAVYYHQTDQPEFFKFLLDHGADPNIPTQGGYTVFQYLLETSYLADRNTYEKTMDLLIGSKKVNLNWRDESGVSLLYHAFGRDDWTFLKMIDAGVDVNADNDSGMPLLLLALLKRRTDLARVLLDHGAKYDARFHYKRTSENDMNHDGFNYAMGFAYAGMAKELELCLDRGAEVNGRDEYGFTPLLWAAMGQEDPDTIRLLIKRGADVDAKNRWGWTALYLVNRFEGNQPLAKILLDAGAKPE